MTKKGIATKAMINYIAAKTINRYILWFEEHPDEPYCYWCKDDPIAIADKDNKELLAKHPEIEDINDHTIVEVKDGILILSHFCPRLREGIADMLADGYSGNVSQGVKWWIEPDGDNYKLYGIKKADN